VVGAQVHSGVLAVEVQISLRGWIADEGGTIKIRARATG
jgi:hypothetical protein